MARLVGNVDAEKSRLVDSSDFWFKENHLHFYGSREREGQSGNDKTYIFI